MEQGESDGKLNVPLMSEEKQKVGGRTRRELKAQVRGHTCLFICSPSPIDGGDPQEPE